MSSDQGDVELGRGFDKPPDNAEKVRLAMIHITIFSGYEGRLQPGKLFYLTLFAGCDLVRPTVARQLLLQQEAAKNPKFSFHKPFFLTLFGGVDIKAPTLSEEFLDLREMTTAGLLSLDDWDRSIAILGRCDANISSFTIFGGISENEIPSENDEVDSLAIQRHLGNIPDSAAQVLQYGIGQKGSERSAAVRRAVLTTV